jgi:hypothetical protein
VYRVKGAQDGWTDAACKTHDLVVDRDLGYTAESDIDEWCKYVRHIMVAPGAKRAANLDDGE